MPLAEIEQGLGAVCAQRPDVIRRVQQAVQGRLREASRGRERDGGIIGRYRDADRSVLRLHRPLGGRDVGPPLEERRGNADGNGGQRRQGSAAGNVQILRILADQNGNRVGVLGARDAETDQAGLGALERDLRRDHGRGGCRRDARLGLRLA